MRAATLYAAALGAIVVIGIGAGVVHNGSLTDMQRAHRDGERLSDLQRIAVLVSGHWRQRQELPQTLGDLAGGNPWRDPKTGEPYDYQIVDAQSGSYRLGAVFETEQHDRDSAPIVGYWGETHSLHDAGHYCFLEKK